MSRNIYITESQMDTLLKHSGLNEEITEMARVGFLNGSKYEIYVNTNDMGKIPHFHLRDSATRGKEFHTCIEITKNKYFKHGNKTDMLNSSMRKDLALFMASKRKLYGGIEITNWQLVVFLWNSNNSDVQIPENTPMPNYTQIEDNQ